jgi:hypothetical protein
VEKNLLFSHTGAYSDSDAGSDSCSDCESYAESDSGTDCESYADAGFNCESDCNASSKREPAADSESDACSD